MTTCSGRANALFAFMWLALAGCTLSTPGWDVAAAFKPLTPVGESLRRFQRIEVVEFGNALGAIVPEDATDRLASVVAGELSGLPGIIQTQAVLGPSATARRVLRVTGRIVLYHPPEAPEGLTLAVRAELTSVSSGRTLGSGLITAKGGGSPAGLRYGIAKGLADWIRSHRE
jgi:hypothetical protein